MNELYKFGLFIVLVLGLFFGFLELLIRFSNEQSEKKEQLTKQQEKNAHIVCVDGLEYIRNNGTMYVKFGEDGFLSRC